MQTLRMEVVLDAEGEGVGAEDQRRKTHKQTRQQLHQQTEVRRKSRLLLRKCLRLHSRLLVRLQRRERQKPQLKENRRHQGVQGQGVKAFMMTMRDQGACAVEKEMSRLLSALYRVLAHESGGLCHEKIHQQPPRRSRPSVATRPPRESRMSGLLCVDRHLPARVGDRRGRRGRPWVPDLPLWNPRLPRRPHRRPRPIRRRVRAQGAGTSTIGCSTDRLEDLQVLRHLLKHALHNQVEHTAEVGVRQRQIGRH